MARVSQFVFVFLFVFQQFFVYKATHSFTVRWAGEGTVVERTLAEKTSEILSCAQDGFAFLVDGGEGLWLEFSFLNQIYCLQVLFRLQVANKLKRKNGRPYWRPALLLVKVFQVSFQEFNALLSFAILRQQTEQMPATGMQGQFSNLFVSWVSSWGKQFVDAQHKVFFHIRSPNLTRIVLLLG